MSQESSQDSDEREMALLRKHKAYQSTQPAASQMSSFRLKDQESVNKVHGLADLSEIELIKKQR